MCFTAKTAAPAPAAPPPVPEAPISEPTMVDGKLDATRKRQQRAAGQRQSGLASTLSQGGYNETMTTSPTLG